LTEGKGVPSPPALGFCPDGASSSSDSDGHVDDLAAQVGNVLADVFGTELVWRTVYCANYTPTLSEHGCERLSHDQPIVFSRP
jgi:hypothetical protein